MQKRKTDLMGEASLLSWIGMTGERKRQPILGFNLEQFIAKRHPDYALTDAAKSAIKM